MSAPVRSKVPSTGGRRKQQKIPDPVMVSDEESVEDESITRCVCGESHSIGLMVCCDQCEVWQHCECMGLEEQEIPEQYYCEQCKPSDHVEVKGYDKTRRYYKPSSPVAPDTLEKRAPKRRTTFNSREASISLEEVLAFRNAIEQSKTYDSAGMEIIPNASEIQGQYETMNTSNSNTTIEDTITVLQDYENETIPTTRQVRPKRQNKKAEEKASAKNKAEKKPRQAGGYTRRLQQQQQQQQQSQQSQSSASPQSTPVTQSNQGGSTRRPNSNKIPRSRTSTPQPEIQTPTSCANSLFEHFTRSARETSPPAKVRLPSHRMSIPDMNRRANQILEYICSMQVEIATSKNKNKRRKEDEDEEDQEAENMKKRQLLEVQISEAMTKAAMELEQQQQSVVFGADAEDEDDEERGKENRRPTPILIPGKFDPSSPSSSLSSASTIPLDENDRLLGDSKCNSNNNSTTEKSVAEEALERANKPKSEQSSMEIMDLLTREVITFQRRFGSLCYINNNNHLLEGTGNDSDGPVTRSREISHHLHSRSSIVDSSSNSNSSRW